MTEEETLDVPENTVEPQTEQTPVAPVTETPAAIENPTQRNLLHLVILAVLLVVGNYLAYQSFKASVHSGDNGNASSADGLANLLNSTKENPSYESYLGLGIAYYNTHRYPEAIDAWQKGLQYKPNSEILYSNMGAAYGCMSKWQEQKEACEKALSINPNFTLAQNNLNWAKSELAKLNGGTPPANNNTGIGTPPGNSTAQFNALVDQGLALYNNKDYNGAIATWKKALEIDPNSVIALTDMGAAYGCLGMWKEQVAVCRKALSINPNFQLAIGNLNWCLTELKKRGLTP